MIEYGNVTCIDYIHIFIRLMWLFFRAKSTFDDDKEKVCDLNHTKKNFTNKLFELRKEKKYSALGPKAIKHLTTCVSYAVKGNTERESLERNLRDIPLHVSGDYSLCGD